MTLIWQNKPPEAPYVYQEYPKWIGDVLVQSAEEETALLGNDTAADRNGLIAQAAEAGVKIDRRWSDDKIRAALAQGSA